MKSWRELKFVVATALALVAAAVACGFFDYSTTPGNIGGIPVCTSAPADQSLLYYSVANGNWCGTNAPATKKLTLAAPAGIVPALGVNAAAATDQIANFAVAGDANPRYSFKAGTGLQIGNGAVAQNTVIDESRNGTLASLTLTTPLAILQGGTGSTTGSQSWVSAISNGNLAAGNFLPLIGSPMMGAESQVNQPLPGALPNTSATIKNLSCVVAAAPGAGNSWTFTLKKGGVATAELCTIAGTNTTCLDTVDSVSGTAQQLFDTAITSAGAPVGTPGQCSYLVQM